MKKIAVLTSGGDAPGMNACVRAVVRTGLKLGCEMYVVYEGYKGLVEGRIEQVDRNFVSDIINRGGTIIRSARLPEFKEEAYQKMAVRQLDSFGIDSLVVIGGDGTYRGAQALAAHGISVVGIPGSIDNDVCSTEACIGFDTAQNTICECVDKLRDTTASHQRCTFIEVMGNKCGDLALFSGIAEGVEIVVINDHVYDEEKIVSKLKSLKGGKKKHSLVIVSEKIFPDIFAFAKRVTEKTGIECRAQVLGHIQRGGAPSARDRILATRYGAEAVKAIVDGESCIALGLFGDDIRHVPFSEAFTMERKSHEDLLHLLKLVNR